MTTENKYSKTTETSWNNHVRGLFFQTLVLYIPLAGVGSGFFGTVMGTFSSGIFLGTSGTLKKTAFIFVIFKAFKVNCLEERHKKNSRMIHKNESEIRCAMQETLYITTFYRNAYK